MIENKICEPINDTNIVEVAGFVKEYRDICRLFNYVENDGVVKISGCGETVCVYKTTFDTTFKNCIKEWLIERLKEIEKQLNVFGYTMQDEPKEFKYHVNVLKGGSDDV